MTPEDVVAYLLRDGFIRADDLVLGNVRVEEGSGRNRNFRVICKEGRGFFLKQAAPEDPSAARAIRIEAELYARAQADGDYSSLRPLLPRLHRYDPELALLVLELRPATESRYEFDDPGSRLGFPPIATAWASAMASWHRLPPAGRGEEAGFLPRSRPWVLDIARPPPAALQDMTPAQMRIIRVLQERPDVCAQLDRLRREWSASALIHRDVKWSNLLIEADPGTGRPSAVRIVDWELACLGDPAWDVGSVFQSYLSHAVLASPLPEDASVEAAAKAFGSVLPEAQAEVRAFWRTYRTETALAGPRGQGVLDRAVRHAAARLIQSAYEWAQGESHPTREALCALQMGANILRRPDAAATSLLGLGNGIDDAT